MSKTSRGDIHKLMGGREETSPEDTLVIDPSGVAREVLDLQNETGDGVEMMLELLGSCQEMLAKLESSESRTIDSPQIDYRRVNVLLRQLNRYIASQASVPNSNNIKYVVLRDKLLESYCENVNFRAGANEAFDFRATKSTSKFTHTQNLAFHDGKQITQGTVKVSDQPQLVDAMLADVQDLADALEQYTAEESIQRYYKGFNSIERKTFVEALRAYVEITIAEFERLVELDSSSRDVE
ncbi:hypothetical protein ACFL3T_00600 [Patescibacteria group bacterium]